MTLASLGRLIGESKFPVNESAIQLVDLRRSSTRFFDRPECPLGGLIERLSQEFSLCPVGLGGSSRTG